MTTTATPYRSQVRSGGDGFGQSLRAEWTKFRTVRGWVIGLLVAVLATLLLGLVSDTGSHRSCNGPGGSHSCYSPPLGQNGEEITDNFYFVHQSLDGNGSITVRVSALTGRGTGIQPWAKTGIIVKDGTAQGSAYAAMMATGDHGVRMQYDFVHDTAGLPGAVTATSPRWLRLTRTGDLLTGYDSTDGTTWTEVGTARLPGLPTTVQIGLFTASPDDTSQGGDGTTSATSVLDHVTVQGSTAQGSGTGGTWQGDAVGGAVAGAPSPSGFQQADGSFTVTGSGDIAPAVGGPPPGVGLAAARTLVGAFAGLIVLIVLGTQFITVEYRRGLIRTTLTAGPRRGRVLAAKAVVIGSVAFGAGLVASAIALPLGLHLLRANGNAIFPIGLPTEVRLVVGTAALLAVTAVFALAIGTITRRSAGAVTTAVALTVLPYLLAVSAVLPAGPSEWLLRLTPAAGFAVQQSLTQYHQVAGVYSPANGYYPLAPWAGFAVLCAWTALAMGLAAYRLRRRDV